MEGPVYASLTMRRGAKGSVAKIEVGSGSVELDADRSNESFQGTTIPWRSDPVGGALVIEHLYGRVVNAAIHDRSELPAWVRSSQAAVVRGP